VGGLSEIEFLSNGTRFRAYLPSSEVWGSAKDVLLFNEYELMPSFSLPSLKGGTVVDVGAQVGLYSLKVSTYAKEVVSVEPSIWKSSLLRTNVARNSVNNIEVRQEAIWSSKGAVKFTDGGAGMVSSLVGVSTGYDVKTTTLDDIVESVGHVDLLKMDVEGAEYESLLSAKSETLKSIDRIVAEIHVFRSDHEFLLEKIQGRLRDSRKTTKLIPLPFQTTFDGLTKPWGTSLTAINGHDPFVFRLSLSLVYSARPIIVGLKTRMDIGSHYLLYAN